MENNNEPLDQIPDQPQINLLRPRKMHGWYQEEPKPKRSFLFYLIPGIIIVLMFSAFSLAKKHNDSLSGNIADYDQITLQPKKTGILSSIKNFIFRQEDAMPGESKGRINILLLGVGGAGHDGPYLSDTNIIASINTETNEVAMVSVPRDLSANIEGYGWTKINHASAYGEMKKEGYGGEFARQTFEKNFGIKIPYYLSIDFKAFTEIIDAVDGIGINVEHSFVDYSYPGPNYSYQTIYFKQGPEKMGGERALTYARSRKGTNGEGSDFARAKRQQIVIAALKNKVLSADTYLNPLKIKKIIDSLSTHISTNLDFGQLMYLAGLSRKIDDKNIKTLVLSNGPDSYLKNMIGYDGAYLLVPKTGNFDQIQTAINNVFSTSTDDLIDSLSATPQTDQLFPSAKIEIQNGTWRVGLAAITQRNLEDQGFAIFTVGNSYKRPVASTTLYILNTEIEQGFIDALEREMGMEATTSLPIWLSTLSSDELTYLTNSTTIPISTSSTTSSTIISATTTEDTDIHQDKYDPQTDILIILGDDYGQSS
ncbi:MAG: LCP family protein [bacterium]